MIVFMCLFKYSCLLSMLIIKLKYRLDIIFLIIQILINCCPPGANALVVIGQ